MEKAVNELKKTAAFLDKKGYLLPGSSSGNISLRNPDNIDNFIITLSGESLDQLKDGIESFCEISLTNNHSKEQTSKNIDWSKWNMQEHGLDRKARDMLLPGKTFHMKKTPVTNCGKSSFETYLHMEIYKNIKNANAVVHLHSPNSTFFSCINPQVINKLRIQGKHSFPDNDTGNVIPYLNVARIAKCGPILWCPDFPAASDELHEYVWRILKENKSIAIILQNHGLLTIGLTSMQAAMVAAEIEQELGIILNILHISNGNFKYFNFIDSESVKWYWKNISKGNPWVKLYSK